ncbi:hypothetical protein EDD11_008573 [Mortierella claussenii]|nr:hypothetical protein EDD11_008573 [Mortierella claussenii]
MPATIFLPWSFLTVTVILAVFQFLLVCAVGAALSIYSRYGGDYANSIRWVRQGGYLEMYNTLVNSRDSVPWSTKLILLATIFFSLAASFADVGAVYFIAPSGTQIKAESVLVKSSQFASIDFQKTFSGLSTSIHSGADITQAMALMINDTRNIPEVVSGRQYTPRTFSYDLGCNSTGFYMWDGEVELYEPKDMCAFVTVYPSTASVEDPKKARVSKKANGRLSLLVPSDGTGSPHELAFTATFNYANSNCSMKDPTNIISPTIQDGISSLPLTLTTKCLLPSGEILVLSSTSIRYFVRQLQDFTNITTSVFRKDGNELVRAMNSSIVKASTKFNHTLLAEVKIDNTTMDSLSCFTAKNSTTSSITLACMYSSINVIAVKQQQPNAMIAAARGGAPWTVTEGNSVAMSFYHLPQITDQNAIHLSPSAAKMASIAASQYIAHLGQNVYMDWDLNELYVLYDTSDANTGLSIPLWLTFCVLFAMAACLGFCSLTQVLLDGRYTGSLYKVMSIQMADETNSYAPMIRWSKTYSMALDDAFATTSRTSTYDSGSSKSDTSFARQSW